MWGVDDKEKKCSKKSRISMPDGKMLKNIEEGGYKYSGILEADSVSMKR